MRKFAVAGVAIVALGGSLGFAGSPAVAAPQSPGSVAGAVAVQAAVPGCVKVRKTTQSEGYKTFRVKNDCSTTKRLKGIFKFGYDSPCKEVRPGATALLSSMQPWVDYDKVVTC